MSVQSFWIAVRGRMSNLRQVPWANSSAAASDLAARGAITTGILTRVEGTGWVAHLDELHVSCMHGNGMISISLWSAAISLFQGLAACRDLCGMHIASGTWLRNCQTLKLHRTA